jgi:hypothetical protein
MAQKNSLNEQATPKVHSNFIVDYQAALKLYLNIMVDHEM